MSKYVVTLGVKTKTDMTKKAFKDYIKYIVANDPEIISVVVKGDVNKE